MGRQSVRGAEEEGQAWERTRTASDSPGRQLRALPVLPVRTPVVQAGAGQWLPGAQPQQWAAAAPVQVEGITVVDDLVREQYAQQPQQRRQHQQAVVSERKRSAEGAQIPPARRQCQGAPASTVPSHGFTSVGLRRQAAKQQLATGAQQLLQAPDKQLPQLKALLQLLEDEDAQICRLAMLTLLAVFKDLLPAYRIRPTQEDESSEKLSKEVRALRTFEAGLLDGYHSYLLALSRALKRSNAGHLPPQQGRIAVKCMAGLLEAAPHFNYKSDLLQALVSCLPHEDQQIRDAAIDGLSMVLASSHGDGEVATEAVQLIADLVRKLKCVAPPAMLDCLLQLRFPDIVTAEPQLGNSHKHKKKKKKEANDSVDRSFQEAQAAADFVTRCNNQTATLDALFELLFRVLKTCTGSRSIQQAEGVPLPRAQFLKKFPLLFPALRLLSKFAHLISMEYIEDIAAELRLLVRSSSLPPEERLRVLLTAAEMMQHQGGAIAVEHAGLYSELYEALRHCSLVPLLEDAASVSSPGNNVVGLEDDSLFAQMAASDKMSFKAGEQVCFLLPSVLQALVVDSRTLDASRQAAFVKRMLAEAAAACDSGIAMGLLCLLNRMFRRTRRLQSMLLHEPGGPGVQGYQLGATDPAEAGAMSAPVWELSLLAQHYHPHVATASMQLAAGSPASLLPLAGDVAAFSATYSTITGGFNPAPAPI